jgi:hypothetical protein
MRTFASFRTTLGHAGHGLRSQRAFAGPPTVRKAPAPVGPAPAGPVSKPISIYPPGGPVQRYAFVNETQVDKNQEDLTPRMKEMASDLLVRDYAGLDEFKSHAEKETDYLGNLKDGTWLRFHPKGINLLGERHTQLTLLDVVPAVGAKSFIYEPLSPDDLSSAPELQKAYETENQERFEQLGIDQEKDKQQYGAESLFPKMGYGLTRALPYLKGSLDMAGLCSPKYLGQPVQRYLKIAWSYSKDIVQTVANLDKEEEAPPKMEALAQMYSKVEGDLDGFITSLDVDGYLGDELVKIKNATLWDPLAMFAEAFVQAMEEMAQGEKRLDFNKGRQDMFSDWRNLSFEDNVALAAKRGVRYAGMGQLHLDSLIKKNLTEDEHPYEMNGKDIEAFRNLTGKLKNAAK